MRGDAVTAAGVSQEERDPRGQLRGLVDLCGSRLTPAERQKALERLTVMNPARPGADNRLSALLDLIERSAAAGP